MKLRVSKFCRTPMILVCIVVFAVYKPAKADRLTEHHAFKVTKYFVNAVTEAARVDRRSFKGDFWRLDAGNREQT